MGRFDTLVSGLVLLAALACSAPDPIPPPPAPDAGAAPRCRSYTPARRVGVIAHPDLKEPSGIAASRRHPGVYYVHNDSGDGARFFAIDEAGQTLGQFVLAGASFTDVEDIALGPCGEADCLYLGDIGDNLARRSGLTIYRVPEPQLDPDQRGPREVGYDALPFTYPDGAHDAETLLADPLDDALYVVTKATDASVAWRLVASANAPQVAQRLGPVVPPERGLLLTGGSLHPSGNRVLLRAYGALFELRGEEGEGFEALLRGPWLTLPPPDEIQGEAVTYLGDGSGYLTVPEEANAPIHRADCR